MTPMKITLSGTPGTGKTQTSKTLVKKLNYRLININKYAKDKNLITGKDIYRKTQIIDEKKLKKESKNIQDNTIIEGHLAHYCKSDITIILRTNPDTLRVRLKKRHWPKKKIEENIDSEALDIILQEAVADNKNVFEIDTTKSTPQQTATTIINITKNRESKKQHIPGKINWEKYIIPKKTPTQSI